MSPPPTLPLPPSPSPSALAPWQVTALCAALCLLLLPSVACEEDEDDPPPADTTPAPKTISAPCDGLAPFSDPDPPFSPSGQVGWWTRIWWQPRFGGPDGCRVIVFDELPFRDTIGFAPWGNVWAGGLGVYFARDGEGWGLRGVEEGGTLRVLHIDPELIDLSFDSPAFDAAHNTNATARVTGSAQGCAYGARVDCPHLTDGGLTRRLTLSLPAPGRFIDPSSTFTGTCRAILDASTQGLQVELEVGVLNGVNVGRWSDQCRQPDRGFPNRLTFQTGGVSGPGTYGPFTTRALSPTAQAPGGATLPALSATLPVTYFGGSRACGDMIDQDLTLSSAPNQTTCTYTLSDRSPHFTLSCEGVAFTDPGAANGGGTGPLRLSTDCDLVRR